MRHFILTLIVITFMTWKTSATANNDVIADIVFPKLLENSLNQDNTLDGTHGKAVMKIVNKIAMTYRVIDSDVAYDAFYEGKYHCITPDSRYYYENASDYIDSLPFSSVNWVIVQQKRSPRVRSQENLKGLTVGLFYPPEEIASIVPQKGVKYEVESNLTVNLLKVAYKRLDLAILPETGLQKMIDENSLLKDVTITRSAPIANVPEAIMCHNNKEGWALIEEINKALENN